jgi:ABC-type transporter Mla maintaining outer membrane lipid asymmetry ATPase subunit MlaF
MSNPASTPIIEMSGVSVGAMRDPNFAVVTGVDWHVAAGDFWVVAGLARSGKSDLLMMTAGLMAARGGSYRLFGEVMPIFEETRLRTRLRLGFVFDGGQMFNHLTVADNIALPLRYHEDLPPEQLTERVDALLELAELKPFARRTPGALGRNWQKRVGLARALALQPEILLLDNPLGGADVREAIWWLNLLAQLSAGHEIMPDKRATTLVVSADDLRPWRERARQFAVLRDGRFQVLGNRGQLAAAADSLVKELLADEAATG